jgi:uncharacterized protein YbaR (Trm112 family)
VTHPRNAHADAPPIDDALLAIVRCPVTGERLERAGDELRTASGRTYRIEDGIAVLVPGANTAGLSESDQADGTDSTGTS